MGGPLLALLCEKMPASGAAMTKMCEKVNKHYEIVRDRETPSEGTNPEAPKKNAHEKMEQYGVMGSILGEFLGKLETSFRKSWRDFWGSSGRTDIKGSEKKEEEEL